MNDKIGVLSFYAFVQIAEPEVLMQKALLIGKKKMIKGTILIAKEGFNGSLSGDVDSCHAVIETLIKNTNAIDTSIKVNYCDEHPFQKFKVKLKKEIVALGYGDIDVNGLKGEYIKSNDWDDFISRDDVVVIDTRNDYEYKVGTFKNSVNPVTETFKQFPEWVEQNKSLFQDKKIAMFCTGGIRCEKSTAFMKLLGYEKVYHLKGGILQYLEDKKDQNTTWEGGCFVFDDRRVVDHALQPAEGHWLQR